MGYAIDNGAWTDFQAGTAFDDESFVELLDAMGAGADFVVLPDIVAGGLDSLGMSVRWLNRCLSVAPLVLIAVQDGMAPADLAGLVGPSVGVFLGGSTEWKVAQMGLWGAFAASVGCYYHVARVNTRGRMFQAGAAGAHSVDGSSGTRFAKNIPMLDDWSRHRDLFAP